MKVLVIGASGFLGSTIYYKLKEKNIDVMGTYSSHNNNNQLVQVDVFDTSKLIKIIKDYQPEIVVWTVMNHKLEEEIAEKVMPKLCGCLGNSRLIFLSTSVAYEKNMTEDVKPYLRTEEQYNYHYFNGKIKSENRIKALPNYCIVRPGSIYGINPYDEMDFRSKTLKAHVDSNAEYIRADNILFSIVEVNELADAVIELITSDYVGILNVSEEEPISHYEFNKALCGRYSWDDSCVVANQEVENIYYLNNDLRKRILKTRITSIKQRIEDGL